MLPEFPSTSCGLILRGLELGFLDLDPAPRLDFLVLRAGLCEEEGEGGKQGGVRNKIYDTGSDFFLAAQGLD